MTAAEIAALVDGRVDGDGDVGIDGIAGLPEAESSDLSFLANPRYAALVAASKAGAVLVDNDWQGGHACTLIRVAHVDAAFGQIAALLGPPPVPDVPGVHPTAVVADDAVLGETVTVGPYCVVESGAWIGARSVLVAHCYIGHEARIGADARLYPFVTVRERVRLGERVIVHGGAVLGSDGFGYASVRGEWLKIPQVGTVEIGDDVEIGANVTVDRARFGKTVIARGSKIDNLVQIAHNVRVGECTAMAAQVGISGSTRIGRHVQLGGQAGLAGHLTVGDEAIVGAQAGVTKDVPPATFVSGYPAMDHRRATRLQAHVARLPELRKKLAELERRLANLEEHTPS
jgi:UDP-3-O-[3-hydroxymyristoyl] glucosamine N-acyltransferase